jgi:glycosyltransferase involved in cell wall biosynthesis
MKLLLIAENFHPPWATGITAFTKGLLEAMLSIHGIDITLLSTSRPRSYMRNVISSDVLKSYMSDFKNMLRQVENVIYLEEVKKKRFVSKVAMLRYSRKLIKRNEYDFVHIVYDEIYPHELAILNLNSTPKINLIKHLNTPSVSHMKSAIARLLYTSFISPINCKPAFSSRFVAKTYGVDSDSSSVLIIPPAINTNVYKPLAANKPEGFDYCLLYVGPLLPDRFPPQVIKAMKLLRSILKAKLQLKIVTAPWRLAMESDYIGYIRSLAHRLGLDEYVNIISKALTMEEKLLLLNQSDAFIQIFKGIPKLIVPVDPPITMLEAMACGGVVITTKELSIPTIIKHSFNGYLLSDLSEEHIARTLFEALISSKEIGFNARKTIVRDFSITKVASLLSSLYAGLHVE